MANIPPTPIYLALEDTMPKAYVMIHLEVTNEEGFSGFASTIPVLLAEFGGRALVGRDAVVSTLENQVTN